MTLRIEDHSWRYLDSDTPTEHRSGRGMWHDVDDCVMSKCGADSPANMEPIPTGDGGPGIEPAKPRVFSVIRYDDVSGVSGTGIVAQGVQFRDGQVVLQWCCPGLPGSVAVWASIEDVLTIHGHRGRTVIKWADGRD